MTSLADPDTPDTWSELRVGIDRILESWSAGVPSEVYIGWYTTIYNHCINTRTSSSQRTPGANLMGGDLYASLRAHLTAYLVEQVRESATTPDDVLVVYCRKWQAFTTSAQTLNHVFSYLNRHWVKREIDEGQRGVYDIYTLCLVSFRDNYLLQTHDKLTDSFLDKVAKQRNGETVDTGMLKQVVQSLVSLGMDERDVKKSSLDLYVKHLENPFISSTQEFYKVASDAYISSQSVPEYIVKAARWLDDEDVKVQVYLHPSTASRLVSAVEQALITEHAERIQACFQDLLDRDRVGDLERMFKLLARVPVTLEPLRELFEAHVRKIGIQAIETLVRAQAEQADQTSTPKDDEPEEESKEQRKKKQATKNEIDPRLFTETLLSVYAKYNQLAKDAFGSEPGFVASLDKACREFVNRNQVCVQGSSKSPELLAKYCDSLLRKSSKQAQEGEIDTLLNSVVRLVYVDDGV